MVIYNLIFLSTDLPTSGPRLNTKTVFLSYGESHVKGITVGETV